MLLKGMDREKAQLFLEQSIAQMCKVTVSFTGPIEIDGIICITGRDKDDLVLVKLHEKLTSPALPHMDTSACERENASNTESQQMQTMTPDLCTSSETVASIESILEHFKSEDIHGSEENGPHQHNISENDSQAYETEALPSRSDRSHVTTLVDDIKTEPIQLDSDYEDNADILEISDDLDNDSMTDSPQNIKRITCVDYDPTEPVAKMMNQGIGKDQVPISQVDNEDSTPESDIRLFELTSSRTLPLSAPSDTSVSCSMCAELFSDFWLLQQHMSVMHQMYVSEQCMQIFNHPNHLLRHAELHNTAVQWVCTICRRSFRRKEHLCHHISCHQKMQLHQCGQCNKGFTARSMLQRHTERHHGGKTKYVCKPCFMEFTDATTFAEHENYHKVCNIRHVCLRCEFTADDRLSLVKHGFVHFGLRLDRLAGNEQH